MLLPLGDTWVNSLLLLLGPIGTWCVLLGSMVGLVVYFRIYQKKHPDRASINNIDNKKGWTLDKYLENMFDKLGYQIEGTRYINDHCADMLVTKNELKCIIQAECDKRKVGVNVLKKALSAKAYYNCDKAMVITNSHYTRQAIEFAGANEVELWYLNDLIKALALVKDRKVVNEKRHIDSVHKNDRKKKVTENVCVVCGRPVYENIRQYSMGNGESIGPIYCFQHQRYMQIDELNQSEEEYDLKVCK